MSHPIRIFALTAIAIALLVPVTLAQRPRLQLQRLRPQLPHPKPSGQSFPLSLEFGSNSTARGSCDVSPRTYRDP